MGVTLRLPIKSLWHTEPKLKQQSTGKSNRLALLCRKSNLYTFTPSAALKKWKPRWTSWAPVPINLQFLWKSVKEHFNNINTRKVMRWHSNLSAHLETMCCRSESSTRRFIWRRKLTKERCLMHKSLVAMRDRQKAITPPPEAHGVASNLPHSAKTAFPTASVT